MAPGLPERELTPAGQFLGLGICGQKLQCALCLLENRIGHGQLLKFRFGLGRQKPPPLYHRRLAMPGSALGQLGELQRVQLELRREHRVLMHFQDAKSGVISFARELAPLSDQDADAGGQIGEVSPLTELRAEHASPVVENALWLAALLAALHLDIYLATVLEAYQDVENCATLTHQLLGQVRVEHRHVSDGYLRLQHGGQQGEQQVAVCGTGEQQCEDDIERGIEQGRHGAANATAFARSTGTRHARRPRSQIQPFLPYSGWRSAVRQRRLARGCAVPPGSSEGHV